jgi:hypothetical protein
VGCDPTRERRRPGDAIGPEYAYAEPVARTVRQQADRGGHSVRKVSLLRSDRAECHARRLIQQQPGVELVLRLRQPQVRLPRPRGDLPVDASYVVTGLVARELLGVTAGTEPYAAVLAMQQPVQPPPDGEVERPEALQGADCPIRAGLHRCPHAATPPISSSSGATRGRGTTSRIEEMIDRGSTPSAIASKDSTRRCAKTSPARSATSFGST